MRPLVVKNWTSSARRQGVALYLEFRERSSVSFFVLLKTHFTKTQIVQRNEKLYGKWDYVILDEAAKRMWIFTAAIATFQRLGVSRR